MNERNLFNEMLTSYPPEKRELAKEIFHRFADGDSSNFFTQLFLVLDVYAHYAERIPAAVVDANRNTLQTIQEMREEIEVLSKAIEQRDLNISNHAENTDELCKITIAKCNETVSKIELMVKNLGSQVDTKTIVKGIEDAIKDTFLPLRIRADGLAHTTESTLVKINAAADRAAELWPKRIWKTALIAGLIVGLSIAALGIGAAYWQMKRHFDRTLAEEISSEKYTLQNNKDAFENLAVADVPVYISRSADSSGNTIPGGYCLYIHNAQGADMKDNDGRIFFISPRPESELKQLLDIQQEQ
jgi:hypothetical protein